MLAMTSFSSSDVGDDLITGGLHRNTVHFIDTKGGTLETGALFGCVI